MSHKPHPPSEMKKRRTTLTLPAATLTEAQRIARVRYVRVSTVIAEALAYGLRLQTAEERSGQIVDGYLKAFAGLSEDEIMILDGIILEPGAPE
jgi:hypothetical protein